MKHTIFISSFINVFILYNLNAMDESPLKPIYKTKEEIAERRGLLETFENRISAIDKAIDCKYKSPFSDFFGIQLSTENMLDILIMATSHNEKIDDTTIEILMEKNRLFECTINHFKKLAQINIEQVTYDTLKNIQNPSAEQTTPLLNKLPLEIKKYVMQQAYCNIKRSYVITLSGHSADIISCEIHPETNVAATSSKDGTFRLWNLATQKQTCILPQKATYYEKAEYHSVEFNSNGSLLATTTIDQYEPLEARITIWKLPSQEQLHTIKLASIVKLMSFIKEESSNDKLLIFLNNQHVLLDNLKKDFKPIDLGYIDGELQFRNYRYAGTYERLHQTKNFDWCTTKNCPPLYLCERTLDNTKGKISLQKFKSTPVYKLLTEYEQDLLDEKLKEKTY